MFDLFCPRVARTGRSACRPADRSGPGDVVAGVAWQPVQESGQAQAPRHAGGEANLVLPDLGTVEFQGINGRTLLMAGLVVCVLGLVFGMVIFNAAEATCRCTGRCARSPS